MDNKLDAKKLIDFIQTYLSIVRKYCSVLAESRKVSFPEFWNSYYQILAIICKDGISIEFRRRTSKNKDSVTVSTRKTLNDVYPQLIGDNPRLPIKGLEGIVVKNLAIATESCFPFLKPEGTLLTIPDDVGFLKTTSGGDIQLQNVNFFYLSKKGIPRQFTFKCLWILAIDTSILFNFEGAQRRALKDFLRQLTSSAPILGEKMKRYSEFDLLAEINTIKQEYITLFNSERIAEQQMQDFLENHGFILSPFYLNITPKMITIKPQMELKSINRKVDFILLKEPNPKNYGIKCFAFEIKKPEDNLFTEKGELSETLKVGLVQINDIFDFIKSNSQEARMMFEVEQTSDMVGIVLIGRRKDLSIDNAKLLAQLNAKNASQKILLYDDLLANIKFISNTIGIKLRQPVVVVGQERDSTEDFTGKSSAIIQEALDYLSKRINGTV